MAHTPHNELFQIVFPYEDEVRCDKCYGVPGWLQKAAYKNHIELTKHFRRFHPSKLWTFVCRFCGRVEETQTRGAKRLKQHINLVHA